MPIQKKRPAKRLTFSAERPPDAKYAPIPLPRAYTMAKVQKMKEEAARKQKARLAAMSAHQTVALAQFQSDTFDDENWVDDIVTSTQTLEFSHAGGELEDLELGQALLADLRQRSARRRDDRTRRDRTQRTTSGFARQLPEIVLAYKRWFRRIEGDFTSLRGTVGGDEDSGTIQGTWNIQVVDMFSTYTYDVSLSSNDKNIPACFVRHGLLPCSPFEPSVAITIRTVEEFRTLHLYCPRLTLEAFTKTICLRLGVCFRRYLATQMQICYDVYLTILRAVKSEVLSALGRADPQYQLRNCCPACTYRIQEEEPLQFCLLWSMDGNDSLKRFKRTWTTDDDNGNETIKDAERIDDRSCDDSYFVPRAKVDEWDRLPGQDKHPIEHESEDRDNPDGSPCEKRWHNMREDKTSSMWRIYDETGLFMATCRHGFVLKCADMVRSGEKSKYALSVLNEMLQVHGSDQGGAYDIGCRFKKTIRLSGLASEAQRLRFTSLVGTWHGFAHSRICQVHNLGIYIPGRGLDPLDTLESKFSKTNHLTSSTRHASRFHRQQEIVEYLQHLDRIESYEHLSATMGREYTRALELLTHGQDRLALSMQHLGLQDPSLFLTWLDEERAYLKRPQDEPLEETLHMSYYTALSQYYHTLSQANSMREDFAHLDPGSLSYDVAVKITQQTEADRMKTLEMHDTNTLRVYAIERELGIDHRNRWKQDSPEWNAAQKLVHERRVRRAVDRLEFLVISRGQELYKARMGDTGYNMRKSIAKHIKTRSKALGPAIDEYNAAAASFSATHPQITLEELLDHDTLADFDILRGTREDISSKPWAKPAARRAMDDYFRTQRAREAVQRLNVEIRRLATYMRDEETYLLQQEADIGSSDPDLAFQVRRYRQERSRYQQVHERELKRISQLPGFSGTINPGTALYQSHPSPGCTSNIHETDKPLLSLLEPSLGDAEEVENTQDEDERDQQELDDFVSSIEPIVNM